MLKLNEMLLEALRAALRQEKVKWTQVTTKEWAAFFRFAQTHQVLPLVLEAVYDCPAADTEILQQVKNEARRQISIQVMKTAEFQKLYQDLLAAGTKPLVLKGLICRNLYPTPDARTSADEDILIPWEQFEAAHQAMLNFGMRLMEPYHDIDAAHEISYRKPDTGLYIELHKSLFGPEQDAVGDLNHRFAHIHEDAIAETIDHVRMFTPSPTDHLFYLICHAFKHFIHSGFGIRQVCDIVMFSNTYAHQIDWDRIRMNCKEIHADLFAAALYQIGEKYLGISKADSWEEVDETALLEDLLAAGVFGSSDMSRKHSSTITLNAFSAHKKGKKSSLLKTLFPPLNHMMRSYPYLKRHPLLLPIAWTSRILHYRREIKNTQGNEPAESIRIGQQRIELLKQYGILNK